MLGAQGLKRANKFPKSAAVFITLDLFFASHFVTTATRGMDRQRMVMGFQALLIASSPCRGHGHELHGDLPPS